MSAPRLVLLFVGSALLLDVALLGLLAALSRPIPDVLPTIAVASLTGLVGLLAPGAGTRDQETD